MIKTVTVTEEDYEKAISVPWDSCTCIVAQALEREFNVKPISVCTTSAILADGSELRYDAFQLVTLFDSAHGPRNMAEFIPKVKSLLPYVMNVDIYQNAQR